MTDLTIAPTNVAAEWSTLGHMLHDPKMIGEVVGVPLEQGDFSQADTRLIYATAVERNYAGQQVDPLIVGELVRDELAQLWSADPAHIGTLLQRRSREGMVNGAVLEHAHIVKALSTKRKLMDACFQSLTAINDGKLSPEEIGDQLSSAALQVTAGSQRRSDLMSWMDTGREYVTQLQRVMQAKAEGREIGVYTGLPFIDDYTAGIGPGELCFMAGDAGVGKALALDTPIPTPGGWTTMEGLEAGATVFSDDGRPVKVLATSAIQYDRECYRVVFSDGSHVVADADHLWRTVTRREREHTREPNGSVKTTREIADSVWTWDNERVRRLNHAVVVAEPLDTVRQSQLVDPYVLGCWLGDGRTDGATLSCAEPELIAHIEACGYTVEKRSSQNTWLIIGLGEQLADLAVLRDKHIPSEYLRGDMAQRVALMGGIVDTDGHVAADGGVEITLTNERLAADVHELALTLGLKATMRANRAKLNGHWVGWRWRIIWRARRSFARLMRKKVPLDLPARTAMWDRRYIRAVIPVPSVPVKCIRVERGMFLATRAMIPTHNSAVAWAAGLGFAHRQARAQLAPGQKPVATLVLSMEMNLYGSTQRLVQSLTKIDGVRLREGSIHAAEYERILREWKSRENLPIRFNFASNFRLSQMRALISEGIRRHNVGFVIVDHFRMIDTDRRYQNGLDADEAKVRFLKENVAKDLNVAVMCLAHTVKIARGGDGVLPKPRMADLRGSGMISAFADQIGFLWSPYKYMSEEARLEMAAQPSDVELLWDKNRWGSPATARLTFNADTMTVLPR